MPQLLEAGKILKVNEEGTEYILTDASFETFWEPSLTLGQIQPVSGFHIDASIIDNLENYSGFSGFSGFSGMNGMDGRNGGHGLSGYSGYWAK